VDHQLNAAAVNVRILLAVGVVIVGTRFVGWLMSKTGQPRVMGEIVAGIVLGPSVLGLALPGVVAYLFPSPVVGGLRVLAQFGLVMFMFLVGLELDLASLRGKGRKVMVISQGSILAPMALAVPLGLWLYPRLGANANEFGFCLFLAAAMSITAFPVLARLLQETGLFRTRIGAVSLLCAAVNDAAAWCLLAVVVAVVGASTPVGAVLSLVLAAVYVVTMAKVVRPLLTRMHSPPMWFVLSLVLLSAWTTEQIGIHAVFGGFLAGAVMPRQERWQRMVHRRLEVVVSTLLLPVFFVIVGLSTRVDRLVSPGLWGVALLVVGVATLGKVGGSSLGARLTGDGWPEALTIGVLMNTRGLTEIVILSVGLELGVITPVLFTIMVLMALTTTLTAAPLVRLLGRRRVRDGAIAGHGVTAATAVRPRVDDPAPVRAHPGS
jgi:Kef-type K+ transport system membrane component KefB